MKAVVFHSIGDIRLEEVKDPAIQQDFDAIVELTAGAISELTCTLYVAQSPV